MSLPRFLAAALALLAFAPARPVLAANTPVFFEPYGELFSARTLVPSPGDERPKDVRRARTGSAGERDGGLVLQAGVVDSNFFFFGGGGLAYAGGARSRHPWQVSVFASHLAFDGLDADFLFVDATGKLVLSQPRAVSQPVTSLVVNFQDEDELGEFLRIVLALDQRLTAELYATGNFGWARSRELFLEEKGIFAGVGLTYAPRRLPRLSLSASYNFDADTAAEDVYSVLLAWAVRDSVSLQLGGGKRERVFANFQVRFD